jgi:uncharacterized protein with GYD domain
MPTYITFFSYTGAAAKAMIDRPSDRNAAAKSLVESLGGKLEAFYWMNGKYDGFLIAQLPDGMTAAALSAAASSSGAFTDFETHEVFGVDAQTQIMKSAKLATTAYKAPTA